MTFSHRCPRIKYETKDGASIESRA